MGISQRRGLSLLSAARIVRYDVASSLRALPADAGTGGYGELTSCPVDSLQQWMTDTAVLFYAIIHGICGIDVVPRSDTGPRSWERGVDARLLCRSPFLWLIAGLIGPGTFLCGPAGGSAGTGSCLRNVRQVRFPKWCATAVWMRHDGKPAVVQSAVYAMFT